MGVQGAGLPWPFWSKINASMLPGWLDGNMGRRAGGPNETEYTAASKRCGQRRGKEVGRRAWPVTSHGCAKHLAARCHWPRGVTSVRSDADRFCRCIHVCGTNGMYLGLLGSRVAG